MDSFHRKITVCLIASTEHQYQDTSTQLTCPSASITFKMAYISDTIEVVKDLKYRPMNQVVCGIDCKLHFVAYNGNR